MTTIKQILCATDLSPASEPAWEEACLLGRLLGAEVLLLYVQSSLLAPVEGYFPPHLQQEWLNQARQETQTALDARLAQARDRNVKARARLVEGGAADRIVEVAREEACDLIVVGTRGRSGISRVLLGSVADRVVRTAARPVLTVRPQALANRPAALTRILYVTDFSPAARAVWPWVVALAGPAGAAVDLLHVIPHPIPDRQLAPAMVAQMARALEEQGEAQAERFLQESQRTWSGRLPRERIHLLVGPGVVAEQILHRAESRGADIIALGTRGWSGLPRWMLGSVAQQIIQTAPCPVLTVGPEGAGELPSKVN
jgi:nucleotide-binding universal stress UspA family protein